MTIQIDRDLRLELVDDQHVNAIFELASAGRDYLRQWLPWIDNMQSAEFIQNFVNGSKQRHKDGNECAFVIIENNKVVGRIGVYKIDNYNKTGEIGYWAGQDVQGKGIVTRCCKKLIEHCFNKLHLNRIEIKCATGNQKSKKIPERLNFTKEGTIRQGEWLHGRFTDLDLYSLLKSDNGDL